MTTYLKTHQPEIMGAIFCLALGVLSGLGTTAGDSAWYLSLVKPSFNPPSWVFGPVWTILYLMMGVAAGKLWKLRHQNALPLALFSIQFIFNLLWSPLFFYFHRIDLALYDMYLLWISLAILMIVVRQYRSVILLLTPYIIWVSFAMLLNFSLYNLNY